MNNKNLCSCGHEEERHYSPELRHFYRSACAGAFQILCKCKDFTPLPQKPEGEIVAGLNHQSSDANGSTRLYQPRPDPQEKCGLCEHEMFAPAAQPCPHSRLDLEKVQPPAPREYDDDDYFFGKIGETPPPPKNQKINR